MMIRREAPPAVNDVWLQLWSVEGAVHKLDQPEHSPDEVVHLANANNGNGFKLGYEEKESGLWLPILCVRGKESDWGWQSFAYLDDDTIGHVPIVDKKPMKNTRAITAMIKYLRLMKLEIDGATDKTVIEVIPQGRSRGHAI